MMKGLAVEAENGAIVRISNAQGIRQDRVENGLNVGRRAADHA